MCFGLEALYRSVSWGLENTDPAVSDCNYYYDYKHPREQPGWIKCFYAEDISVLLYSLSTTLSSKFN